MVYSLQFSVNCKLNPLKKFTMLYDYFYEWG